MEKNKNGNMQLRKMTFFPPFILLLLIVVVSLISKDTFLNLINNINNWIIANVGWVFSIIAVGTVLVAIAAAFSKFGNVRIGGEDAKPEISTFSWFTIAFIFPTHFIGTFIKPSHADAFDMSLRPCSAIHPELTTFFRTNGFFR
jgi:choline-glycine betaine transporter